VIASDRGRAPAFGQNLVKIWPKSGQKPVQSWSTGGPALTGTTGVGPQRRPIAGQMLVKIWSKSGQNLVKSVLTGVGPQ
jgi:hypothetical protein